MPTGIFGPIPPGTVGLLLGRSSLTSKGITIHTGVIDSDYEGEIQIITSSSVPWTTQKGEWVTQLLLLPYTLPEKRETQKNGNWTFWKHRTGRDFSSRNLWGRDLLTQWKAEIWIPPGQYIP